MARSLKFTPVRNVATARRIQERLRHRVITIDDFGEIRRIAGIDVGFERGGTVMRAAVVLLEFPSLAPCGAAVVRRKTSFPYVPGYLSFREAPAVLAAVKRLRVKPDLIVCDGQGLAHPRRFGLACHLGLLLDVPSIGAAKSRLTGTHAAVPRGRGAWVSLRDQDELIGAVLRTRTGVKPLYVSVGHRISLPSAIEMVLRCTTGFRLPETTRYAHRLASGIEQSRIRDC